MFERRIGSFFACLALVAVGCGRSGGGASQSPAAAAAPAAAPVADAPGAAAFTLPVLEVDPGADWSDAAGQSWQGVVPVVLTMNTSPPSFSTDAPLVGAAPEAEARAVRAGQTLYVRLRWTDPTVNRSRMAQAKAYGDDPIYRKPTTDPAAFADAAAVMVPGGTGWKARYPGVMMGEAIEPVRIFYWRDGEPASVLEGLGRGAVAPVRTPVAFKANLAHDGTGWAGVFVLPAPEDSQTPLAFAIWDGARTQRNGDKFYSPWYRPAKAVGR